MNISSIVTLVQFFFAVVIGLYFWNLLKSQQGNKVAVERESRKEMEKLRRLRSVSLTEPLSEKTRPTRFEEVIGQNDGIKALRAALCGPNPQHVLVYGPPGVGKTAAARLVLEEAKRMAWSPFQKDARFVELDATTARFDERGIADPMTWLRLIPPAGRGDPDYEAEVPSLRDPSGQGVWACHCKGASWGLPRISAKSSLHRNSMPSR